MVSLNLINLFQKLNRNWLFHGTGRVFLIGIASRILIFSCAIAGFYIFGTREALPGEILWNSNVPIINLFSRWDAGIYAQIAQNGYPIGTDPISSNWAWFPLYPLSMGALGSLFSGLLTSFDAVLVAGFIISNVLFFVSLFFFYELSKMILKSARLGLISTVFFSFWPGALFYSCVYSESMFIALALGAFYFLEKGRAVKSILLGFLASFTWSGGFLVFIPFMVHGLQKRNYRSIIQSVIIASPYLLFNIFGYFSTGLFPIREIVYNQYWAMPDSLLTQISYPKYGGNQLPIEYSLLFIAELSLIIFPFIYVFFKQLHLGSSDSTSELERNDLKYWAFSFATLATVLFYSFVFSIQRYALLILPIYWVSAIVFDRNKKLGKLILYIMIVSLMVGTILFATWRIYY